MKGYALRRIDFAESILAKTMANEITWVLDFKEEKYVWGRGKTENENEEYVLLKQYDAVNDCLSFHVTRKVNNSSVDSTGSNPLKPDWDELDMARGVPIVSEYLNSLYSYLLAKMRLAEAKKGESNLTD